MTKPANSKTNPGNSRPGKAGAGEGHDHQWLGESVEKTAPANVTDEAEAAASRAEGNATISAAAAARDRGRAAADPATFGLSADGEEEAEADGNDEESVEEKRQAAVEAHAASTSKRPPHGRL